MKLINKRNLIILIIAAAIVGGVIWKQKSQPTGQIVTAKVQRGQLIQSVEPSGSIKSKSEINLNFDMVGRIASMAVKVGDEVKAGQLLARLDTKNLDSAVNQAAADLAKTRGNLGAYEAGATPETIAQYEADVQKAEANLAKAQADLANLKISLKQTFDNAYINQINTLQGSITTLETAMTDMDTVLGVENSAANDTFDKAITTLDNSSFYYSQAKADFTNARLKLNEAKTASQTLTTSSTNTEIDAATTKIKTALDALAIALGSTWTVLDKLDVNAPNHNLTISQVTTKKTTIDTDRAAITVKKTSVLSGEQTVAAARLNYEGATGSAGSSQVAQYEANVKIYEAALSSAQASLAAKKAPPRQVDLESYRAAIRAAEAALATTEANRHKALIYAPVAGVITKKNNEAGESNSSATPVLVLMPVSDYEIEANVSEADITKIKIGQNVDVTLDAYDNNHIFKGRITSIDPAETLISDVVYYKVKAVVDPAETLKSGSQVTEADLQGVKAGMTANVTIFTNQRDHVLMIPERAIEEKNSRKYVRVLIDPKNQKMEEKEITTGLRGNEGLIEVVSGLSEGEEVVTFTKNGK